MKKIYRAADRLLSALVPAGEAGACVPDAGDIKYYSCGCGQGRLVYRKTCRVTCTGQLDCGACYRTSTYC